jgi:hypothetical protein
VRELFILRLDREEVDTEEDREGLMLLDRLESELVDKEGEREGLEREDGRLE